MRLGLSDFAVSAPDQNSCSICFINENQCKGKKLLDITEIIDGEKSCLEKIQELMHTEVVLGYSMVCVSCVTEINSAYILQEKIINATKFWKNCFGYEKSADLNMVSADDISTEQKECDVSINTIPKSEKIEVEEETDDDDDKNDYTLMDERDGDTDPLDFSKDSNSDDNLTDIKNKARKNCHDTSKQMKSKILEDLTIKTVTVIPAASIENITGAAIKKISNVTKEGEKENSDMKKSNLFCGKCNYYYADISEILTHVCSSTKSNNQKKKTAKKQPIRKEPKPIDCYGCAACGKIFKRRIDLNKHQKYQHAVIRMPSIDCDACGKEFQSKMELSRHIKDEHSNLECFGCAACGKMFETKIDLTKHQKDEHSYSLDKPKPVCNICNKSFTNETLLRLHNSIHTGEHNFCCDVCGQTFKYRGSIYKHIRMHNSGKYNRGNPFLCTICGKLFPNSSQMSRHKMWHEGVKNYECQICNKKFSRPQHLTVHMRSHTGEKPYTCQFCDQAFSEKSSVRKHILAKHAEKIQTEVTEVEDILP